MHELETEVLRILKGRREAGGAIRLWEELCEAFERGGAEALEEILSRLAPLPEDAHGDEEEEGA